MSIVTGEEVAQIFLQTGLVNTSKWITYALNTKLPDPEKDFVDIVNSLKIEFRNYKKEHYKDSSFRESCFDAIWRIVLLGISEGQQLFIELSKELFPLLDKLRQTSELLEDIVNVAEKLEPKPKFYMVCFYYLMLMEGNFKNVKKNLFAMEQMSEGKKVTITETLGLRTDKDIEEEKNLKRILPKRLKTGIHDNLRNAIAHANFRYIDEENKMEFWDIYPRTQTYSLEPIKLTYGEFSKSLLEVNFFCEIFGFFILLLIVLGNIGRRHSSLG